MMATLCIVYIVVLGWISDSTGQYNEAFYYGGGLFILGGIFSLLVPLHIHCCQNRKRRKYELETINSLDML